MTLRRSLSLACFVAVSASIHAQKLRADRVYPAFDFGPTGIRLTIEKDNVVTVAGIADESPASKGDIRIGDVLLEAQRRALDVADPRVPLGLAIGDAEASSGRLRLARSRNGREKSVTITIPKLGAYSDTWPRDCAKSRRIIAQTIAFLVAAQNDKGAYRLGSKRAVRDNVPGCLASLFLLSTGDDALLPHVERHALPLAKRAESRRNAGGHVNWQLGYQGILLAEYHLRTGDKRVLAGLQELCDWTIDNQAAGGWGHGENVGAGYTQSGLMNHAGIPVLVALTLAQECGLRVDRAAYARAVKLMYRMAGHGCIAYGDHRSELGWSTTNGRNSMVACAFSLLSDHDQYRHAAEHLGSLVADSYYQPEFGHTGGGFNVMWRGLGSVHAPKSRRKNYRRQMDELRWYFDLCRRGDGAFSMPATPPDNKRYTGIEWGTGAVALNYTAPLHTLRITGAPRTQHGKRVAKPDFEWGTVSDLAFFSVEHADGFGEETATPHEVYDLLIGKRKKEATVAFAAQHLHHYSPMVRTWAARSLEARNDADAHAALVAASKHADPRVRRAAFDAISGYDNWRRPPRSKASADQVSRDYLPAIAKTLGDEASAWWELDGALFALGRARPDDIRKHMAKIRAFGEHEDWYLRDGAFWALVGVRSSMTTQEFDLLAQFYRGSRHVFERSSYDAGFRQLLRKDKVAYERTRMRKAVETLGTMMHEPAVMLGYGTGGIHEAAHRTMMILKHFDPDAYTLMVDDFVKYLDAWEPYYQHSVWLITGSKWQPGILAVLEGLGTKGQPIVRSLKSVLARYATFDAKRIGNAGADLEDAIRDAVDSFENRFGRVRDRSPR